MITTPRKLWKSGEGTVKYSLHVHTKQERGSALYFKNHGVNVALVNTDGCVLMHRHAPSLKGEPGDKDTIEFSGIDIGKVQEVWISPEQGTWRIQEVALESDFQKTMFQRDFDHDTLFRKTDVSTELDHAKYEKGMQEYRQMKQDIFFRTSVLATLGTVALAVNGMGDLIPPFASGAGIGVVYQRMLQHEVDNVGPKANMIANVYTVLNTMMARLGMVFVLVYTILHAEQQHISPDDTQMYSMNTFWVTLMIGFALNKLALWSVMGRKIE